MSLFAAAKESSDPLGALVDLVEFFFHGLAEAAALGAGRVNVQGWGEALVNPPLLETIRQVMDTCREALAEVSGGRRRPGSSIRASIRRR